MEHTSIIRLLDSTLPRLANTERHGLINPATRSALESTVSDLRNAMEAHRSERERIFGDPNLSETGQHEAAGVAFERSEQLVVGAANDMSERVNRIIDRARTAATPKPSGTPTTVFEAQLGNARADARMVLDPLPANELHTALASLAEDGSEAMRHLILATDWPTLYIRSRGSATADALWANQKPALMPLVLDEQGQAAVQRLQGVKDLRAVEMIARRAVESWQREMKPRGWTPAA